MFVVWREHRRGAPEGRDVPEGFETSRPAGAPDYLLSITINIRPLRGQNVRRVPHAQSPSFL